MPVVVDMRGEKEAREKILQVARDLTSGEFVSTLRTAALLVERDAKILAPVDTGRLRASITSEIRVEGKTVLGVVGSNVEYAPYMEFGAGVFIGRQTWFPPAAALEVWARRHGFESGHQVAYLIYRRGGTPGKKFLQRAFQQNQVRVVAMLGDAVARIVRK